MPVCELLMFAENYRDEMFLLFLSNNQQSQVGSKAECQKYDFE